MASNNAKGSNRAAACAYWISPEGEIIDVLDRHIHVVINDPARFGLTLAQIQKAHEKHKEKLFSEGNARTQIMAGLIKKGWIRLRYMPKDFSWTIQAHKLDKTTSLRLASWAKFTLRNKAASRNMGVAMSDERGRVFPSAPALVKDLVTGG